jgi:hypothetical protein
MKWKLVLVISILFSTFGTTYSQKLSWEIDLGVDIFQYGEIYSTKTSYESSIHGLVLPNLATGITYRNRYFASGINMSLAEFAHGFYSLKGRLGFNALFFTKEKPKYFGPFIELGRVRTSWSGATYVQGKPWEVKYMGAVGLEIITDKLEYSLSYGSFFRFENNRFISNLKPSGYYNLIDGLMNYIRFSVAYQLSFREMKSLNERKRVNPKKLTNFFMEINTGVDKLRVYNLKYKSFEETLNANGTDTYTGIDPYQVTDQYDSGHLRIDFMFRKPKFSIGTGVTIINRNGFFDEKYYRAGLNILGFTSNVKRSVFGPLVQIGFRRDYFEVIPRFTNEVNILSGLEFYFNNLRIAVGYTILYNSDTGGFKKDFNGNYTTIDRDLFTFDLGYSIPLRNPKNK